MELGQRVPAVALTSLEPKMINGNKHLASMATAEDMNDAVSVRSDMNPPASLNGVEEEKSQEEF